MRHRPFSCPAASTLAAVATALLLSACAGSSNPEPLPDLGLRITNIEATTVLPYGGHTEVKIYWASTRAPKYPMTRKTTVIKCPGAMCDFGTKPIPTESQPHVTNVYCRSVVGELVLTYQLTDGNGEQSNIVEKTFMCTPPKV